MVNGWLGANRGSRRLASGLLQYSRQETVAACMWWGAVEVREVDRFWTSFGDVAKGLADGLEVRTGPYAQGHC